MMRTLIQKALDPQVGDRMFFSNQVRIRSGERHSLSISPMVREVVWVPTEKKAGNYLHLSTTAGPLSVSVDILLEKYSPHLDLKETALNRVQKLFILLAFHGLHQELMDLIVQVEL